MKVILPWKGKLTATFLLGVLRVVAFIGVGVLGADRAGAEARATWPQSLAIALPLVAPLSGVLHWLESWLAHDMAFRLLAEMRIDAFRKLDALAPAYLVRRRTGDLMALATHDIELVEYFFAHTVAPAFVAILVPAAVIAALAIAAGRSRWRCCRSWRRASAPSCCASASTAWAARRARRRAARRLRRRLGAGAGRDRRLPGEQRAASAESQLSQRHIDCACRSSASSRASTPSSKC